LRHKGEESDKAVSELEARLLSAKQEIDDKSHLAKTGQHSLALALFSGMLSLSPPHSKLANTGMKTQGLRGQRR